MRLFIAEKPDLAKVIAEALGNPVRKSGYIQCGTEDFVTWCVGHLLELCPPEAHNPEYKMWNAAHLPLQLRPAKYQPIEKTQDQLRVVGELISRADEIVHAGDPDDEGQLLVEEVLVYFGNSRPVKRILINDLNATAASKALQNLRNNSEFQGLYRKALARSIGDQLYGFNLTRACTLAAQAKGIKGVLSVGRVQTPILGLIVNRYLAFTSHSSAFFYSVMANITAGSGQIKAKLVVVDGAPTDEKGRITDQAYAEGLANKCRQALALVKLASVVEKKEPAPLPFALLDLQVYMSQAHGIDAEKTLALTQALREKHKAITYNRSDCKYLSEEQFTEAPHTLDLLSQALPDLQGVFSLVDSERKSRAFNDKKVTAHTAIIPTAVRVNLDLFSEDERTVYMAIVARYLAQFMPEKRFLSAEVQFDVAGSGFVARAKKTTEPGWSVLVSAESSPEADAEPDDTAETDSPFELLAALQVGQTCQCKDAAVSKEKTKPLPLYTEATLLQDLQRVAKYVIDPRIKQLLLDRDQGKTGEHGGIGTPATRAAMLAKLQERGFYAVEKKKLIPTALGLAFIAALPAIATTPDMTALWHEQQQMIEAGELTVDAFLDDLEQFIAEQVKAVDLEGVEGLALPKVKAPCPMDGKELVTTPKLIACRACSFRFYPEIASKVLTVEQIETLFTQGKTGVLKGFKNKDGKPFDAALKLNHEAKAEFVFKKR